MSRLDAPYARVCPSYWQSARRKGRTQDATLLGIYLCTCRHKTTEGLYELPLQYALADLPSTWKLGRLKKAMRELEAGGFARYDWATSIVLLPSAMEYQRPENPNQVTHALRKLAALPETTLWPEFLEAAEKHAPEFYEKLLDHFPQGLGQGLPQGLAQPQALAPALAPTQSQDSISKLEAQSQYSSSTTTSPPFSDGDDPDYNEYHDNTAIGEGWPS